MLNKLYYCSRYLLSLFDGQTLRIQIFIKKMKCTNTQQVTKYFLQMSLQVMAGSFVLSNIYAV